MESDGPSSALGADSSELGSPHGQGHLPSRWL